MISLLRSILFSLAISSLVSHQSAHAELADEILQPFVEVISQGQSEAVLRETDEERRVLEALAALLSQDSQTSVAVEEYYAGREKVRQGIVQALKYQDAYYWIERLDRRFIQSYLLSVARLWAHLPSGHIGQRLLREFESALSDGRLQLEWLKRIYYGSNLEVSRGVYHSQAQRISIQLSHPSDLIAPLAHELTHFLDQELLTARNENEMSRLYREQSQLRSKKPNWKSWSEEERAAFARYWFLTHYERNFAEVVPKFNACLIYTALLGQGLITRPAQKDLSEYEKVIAGELDCEMWIIEKLQRQNFKPQKFWQDPRSWQYRLVDHYEREWQRAQGFSQCLF